jgi:HK97 family phage prohead protease
MMIDERGTGRQIRHYELIDAEIRADKETGYLVFEGVASTVDMAYSVRDQFGEFEETISVGGFDKTLLEVGRRSKKGREQDVALFVNHDYRALPLATVSGGRLDLSATPHLHTRALLNPARPSVQEAQHAINDGDARQMSIGFTVPKGKDHWSEDMSKRVISEVSLHEVSIVWQGANHHTAAAMRAFDEFMESLTDFNLTEEERLRVVAEMQRGLPPEAEVVPDLAEAFAERDRQDRERLERKRLLRLSAY